MGAAVTLLHLSDIHFDVALGGLAVDRAFVLEQLVRDLGDLDTHEGLSPDLVLVTGDIGARGGAMAEEYELADTFLGRIREATDLARTDFFVVAGNHDVLRTRDNATRRVLEEAQSRGNLEDLLVDPEDKPKLLARFEPFKAFADRWGPTEEPAGVPSTWYVERPGRRGEPSLRLAGLNTALCSFRDDEEGRLQVDRRHLTTLMANRRTDDEPVTLVLGHHPFSWLHKGDILMGQLAHCTDAYFCGHMHEPAAWRTATPASLGVTVFQAGAVHSHGYEEDVPFAYSLVRIEGGERGSLSAHWWPRTWSSEQQGFVPFAQRLPKDRTFGSIPLRPGRARSGSDPRGHEASLKAMGRRRTAFPTDMSFSELIDNQLFVEPELEASGNVAVDLESIEAVLRSREAVLLLGEPGAGKSLLSYRFALLLRKRGLSARYVDLATVNDGQDGASKAPGGHGEILLIDGVDEALNGGHNASDVASALESAVEGGPCLVVCRRFDYENVLSASIRRDMFSMIVTIRPWRFDVEFSDFVQRLEERGFLDAGLVGRAIEDVPGARNLVSRPLHARMLTFVLSKGRSVGDVATLYDEYLRHLARRAERASPGGAPVSVMQLWRHLCSAAHGQRLIRSGGIPTAVALSAMVGLGASTEQAKEALRVLFDALETATGSLQVPIHFSFVEFLTASAVASDILVAADHDRFDANVLGERELPREMRRYLVGILRSERPSRLDDWMVHMFDGLRYRERILPTLDLIRCNLVIYLAGRLPYVGTELLVRCTSDASNEVLVNSAYWALIVRDDREAALEYLHRLKEDPLLAQYNRGYHLYYFGDIDDDEDPPYVDDGTQRWANTRLRLLELISVPDIPGAPRVRLGADLLSLLSFFSVRAVQPSPDESLVIDAALGRLRRVDPAAADAVAAVRTAW